MRNLSAITVIAVVAFAACEPSPRAEPPAVTEARQAAARDVCIAWALAVRAQEGLTALQEFQQEPAMAGISRAALEFAAAAEHHAQLRYAAIAYTDSALNHARTPADSARYMERSDAFEVRRPQPGTLEENIAASWMRDYAAIRADEDHRCNWDF
jgi:hypothetical protein